MKEAHLQKLVVREQECDRSRNTEEDNWKGQEAQNGPKDIASFSDICLGRWVYHGRDQRKVHDTRNSSRKSRSSGSKTSAVELHEKVLAIVELPTRMRMTENTNKFTHSFCMEHWREVALGARKHMCRSNGKALRQARSTIFKFSAWLDGIGAGYQNEWSHKWRKWQRLGTVSSKLGWDELGAFHPQKFSSKTTFIPKPLSSKTTFIQNHFHPKKKTLSSKTSFIQNHFHPKP